MITLDKLASPYYRGQLNKMETRWAGTAQQFVPAAVKLARKVGAETILDYGCGPGSFAREMAKHGFRVAEYDPGVGGKERLPKPADLVVCTDVLEHVEPEHLSFVLAHLNALTKKAALLYIATRPAEKLLPDGRNAHLIVESADWWFSQLCQFDWQVHRVLTDDPGAVQIWTRKVDND